jgi:hypothetical protein
MTAAELQALAAQEALAGGYGAANTAAIEGGGLLGSGAAEQAAAPVVDKSLAAVADHSVNASLGQQAYNGMQGLFSNAAGGGGPGSAGKLFLAQQGMNMMAPRPGPQAAPGRPMQAGNTGPLTNPYGSSSGPYGTPQGNSLGVSSLTEEQKRKLRAAGYNV